MVEFTGGYLCLPDLNIKFRFLPGEIVLFCNEALQHFISKALGIYTMQSVANSFAMRIMQIGHYRYGGSKANGNGLEVEHSKNADEEAETLVDEDYEAEEGWNISANKTLSSGSDDDNPLI
ncbi:hypothetical protein B7494_g4507 [Chlorociboria aeruginascens]|nr:hypothetical protein B7494_g4507 [Chlorociboria aeruginascens]